MQLPETFAATCCQVIRDRRQKLGLSQEEIARRSGLARSYICDVERGARHPSLRNVSTLARALEIATSELIAQVELNLAARVDFSALKDKTENDGLHSEIIRYYNEKMTDGIIIADNEGFIFFNSAAQSLTGVGRSDAALEEWSDVYGCFQADRVTKIPSRELPLARAIAGESVDNVEVHLRNASLPDGKTIRVTGRPVKGENGGPPIAGVVIFHEV
ncbi:MAG: helix-turn-helix domain-containing protein [Candidatus Obscuribacterales bacterium]|nr:helix-turn-helix domain-containing protein [Candidatus Obscuribacterales bacterium]